MAIMEIIEMACILLFHCYPFPEPKNAREANKNDHVFITLSRRSPGIACDRLGRKQSGFSRHSFAEKR